MAIVISVRRAFAPAAIGLAGLGCGYIVGVDEYRTTPAPASSSVRGDGGYTLASANWRFSHGSCGACMAKSCSMAVSACHADPTCDAFGKCAAQCEPGDADCGTNCERGVQGTYFAPSVFELQQCGIENCLSECGVERDGCGAIPAPGLREAACCKEERACTANDECRSLLPCFVRCSSASAAHRLRCLEDCGGPNAATNELQNAFWNCYDKKCDDTCQGFGDDSCLGSVVVPPASDESRKTFMYVRDTEGIPLSGVLVEECARSDVNCTNPFPDASETTGPDGLITLEIKRDFTGQPLVYFRATGPGMLPHRFYPPLFWFNYSVAISFAIARDVGALAAPPIAGHGAIGFGVRSCGAPRTEAGVAVSISQKDSTTQTLYFSQGTPSAFAEATDVQGFGAFTNVPVGSVTLESTRVVTGARIGTATGYVADGEITIIVITPTP